MIAVTRTSLLSVRRLPAFSLIRGILILALAGCSARTAPNISPDGKPNVVATSTILANLTQDIGGDEIHLTSILKPGSDPHVYEPIPADSIAFEKANLILYNGYHLEPGLIRLMDAAGLKAKKVAIGEVATPIQTQRAPDPHVWGSVQNSILMVQAIRDTLSELAPEDREIFTQNAAQLIAELQRLDSWIKIQIATIPPAQRKLITTHDAFAYYARDYGLEISGTLIGISTEEQPSARTVKRLADTIKSAGVPAIFAETTINPQLITAVAREAGTKIAPQSLYADSIGAPGSDGDTYIKMLAANTRAIVEALGGTYTPLPQAEKINVPN
ncbi:zinc ABC transporter substrate-binding protein [Oscillatoria sp. FACHB-1406]|uniref:metal ABC transporter solute-binding protein, Zn/Mn family n=1 Tax=Oscillatoria sp. FACHB-1406 TaxID=2692846 RepID=UPI0018EF742C|nr:zinc ABC transporter substrate-binding protein [Oscillatoria sp. FACHB-1406]